MGLNLKDKNKKEFDLIKYFINVLRHRQADTRIYASVFITVTFLTLLLQPITWLLNENFNNSLFRKGGIVEYIAH